MKQYDVVVIGSSPICMIEAIYWVSLGKSVLLLEKKEVLGGSWKVIPKLGFKFLEIGPHVFFGPKKGYEIFKILNLKLESTSIWNFDIHNNILYRKLYLLQNYFLCKFKKIKKTTKVSFYKSIIGCLNINNKVAYLKNGCVDLLKAIYQLNGWDKVDVKTLECESVEILSDKTIKIITNKDSIICNKLIITSCCNIDLDSTAKTTSTKNIQFEKQDFGSAQVTLILKNNQKELNFTKFQYSATDTAGTSNFLKEKKYRYIVNLTKCVENANNVELANKNISVVSIAVDPTYFGLNTSSPDIQGLVNELISFNLISSKSDLIDFGNDIVNGQAFSQKTILSINQFFDGYILCLESEAIIHAFANNYDRWSRVIGEKR